LDVVDWRVLPQAPPFLVGVADWLKFAWTNLFTVLTNATMAGVTTGLNSMRLDASVLYRVSSRFTGATQVGQAQMLSRRAHLAGIIIQHGEFQRRHALIRQGPAAGPLDSFWLPKAGGTTLAAVPQFQSPAPAPGANSEDPARADYLAYAAVCYLAFNASPTMWNAWVAAANAVDAANIPRVLLFSITEAQAPGGHANFWIRGNFVRFAVGLDAYLRMSDTGAGDVTFPVRGDAGWPP
jgi:hypothetical protein